jgi:hypothetical protein
MRNSLRPLLLLSAAAHAFIGPAPLRCRVPRRASDRDGSIDDADEAARVAAFRARLLKGGLDAVAKDVEPTEEEDEVDPEWARLAEKPRTGVVLIGRKDWFFADKPSGAVKSALKRVGLAADAAQRIPEDRLAGLVPVVLILDGAQPKSEGFSGVLLGRRSGYMMGDLKELYTTGFMLQPLWADRRGRLLVAHRADRRRAGKRRDHGHRGRPPLRGRNDSRVRSTHGRRAVRGRRLADGLDPRRKGHGEPLPLPALRPGDAVAARRIGKRDPSRRVALRGRVHGFVAQR